MAVIVTFDPIGLIIEEVNTGLDVNDTDQAEIYSEWKDWVLADPASRLGYPPAFRTVGSDPISDIQNLGSTYFLSGGWKYRPAEYNHQWVINGNVFTDPAGERRTTPTLGGYTVEVTFFVSNLVDAAVARLDLAQLQEAVYLDTINGVPGTTEGIGTPTRPSNNLADTLTIAIRDNLRAISLTGAITLTTPLADWSFRGTVSRESASIDLNGQALTRCQLTHITLNGNAAGATLFAFECGLGTITNALGTYRLCGLSSLFSAGAAGTVSLEKCFSTVTGTGHAVLDLADNLSDNLLVSGWHGGLELRNVDVPGQLVTINADAADIVIDATCIDGTVLIRGPCTFTDNSTGSCVVIDQTTPSAVWEVDDARKVRFNKGVHIDTVAGAAGTAYPLGTHEYPSSNIADALAIAATNSLDEFYIRGVVLLTQSMIGKRFYGDGEVAEIRFQNQDVGDSQFYNLRVKGTIAAGDPIQLHDCVVDNVNDISGRAYRCLFTSTAPTRLDGDFTCTDCASDVAGSQTPEFNVNGGGNTLKLHRWSGGVEISGMSTGANKVSMGILGGQVILASTCTAGEIELRGIGNLTDNKNGTSLNRNAFLNLSAMAGSVWDELLANHTTAGSTAAMLRLVQALLGGL